MSSAIVALRTPSQPQGKASVRHGVGATVGDKCNWPGYSRAEAKMPSDDAKPELDIIVADDFAAVDIGRDNGGSPRLRLSQMGTCNYRPLTVFVRDPRDRQCRRWPPRTVRIRARLCRFVFLPEDLRRKGIGSRVLVMAEQEGSRRGCRRILLAAHVTTGGLRRRDDCRV